MKEKFYDLTNPQKSIWYTEQFFQGSCVNNLCGTVAIDQVVNFDILKKAIYKFVVNSKVLSNIESGILPISNKDFNRK